MTRAEIEKKVETMMVEMFEISPSALTPNAKLFEDLGLDSIDAVDMMVKLQEMTGRRVDEAALKSVRTVTDVVSLVEKHLQG